MLRPLSSYTRKVLVAVIADSAAYTATRNLAFINLCVISHYAQIGQLQLANLCIMTDDT